MFHNLNKKSVPSLGMNVGWILLALIICGGCATNNVEDPRTYTVSSTSQQDIGALNNVANAAAKFCSRQNKHFEITDSKTKYLGLTDEQKRLVRKANKAFDESRSASSDRDYKVTIKFHCIPFAV